MIEDDANSKNYGKHILMQLIKICNLSLLSFAIVSTGFSPLQVFQLPCFSVT